MKKGRKKQFAQGLHRLFWKLTKGRPPGFSEVEQNLKLLYAGESSAEKVEHYYREKVLLLWKVVLAGLCLMGLLALSWWKNPLLKNGCFLPRKNAAYVAELLLTAKGEEKRTWQVRVEPQKPTAEESKKLLSQVKEEMEDYILGENPSLEEVRTDLRLSTSLLEGQVTAVWELDSYEVLNLDGSIRKEPIGEDGKLVELTAALSCNGETDLYRGCARILPPILSPEELWKQEVEAELERLELGSGTTAQKELPGRIQGKELLWKEKRGGTLLMVTVLFLVVLVIVYGMEDRRLKERVMERELQMRCDYAQIVSKLVLLMGAGSTIRCAWELIVQDYQRKREQGQRELRYAYEEMALACKEMKNGVAEARAYENFGVRCRIPCYLKLSALLEQNLKKGARGLTQLLELEVQEAFEQRKELARRRGEEAATKLLLPMMLLLVVVMLIIIIPAWLSMRV